MEETSIAGPNEKTEIVYEKETPIYVLHHTFYYGEPNHPEEGLLNLEEIIAKDGYTGKCPFDGCQSIISPEDIKGVLSDEFYENFKEKMPTKKGGRRHTYRRKNRKTRKTL